PRNIPPPADRISQPAGAGTTKSCPASYHGYLALSIAHSERTADCGGIEPLAERRVCVDRFHLLVQSALLHSSRDSGRMVWTNYRHSCWSGNSSYSDDSRRKAAIGHIECFSFILPGTCDRLYSAIFGPCTNPDRTVRRPRCRWSCLEAANHHR